MKKFIKLVKEGVNSIKEILKFSYFPDADKKYILMLIEIIEIKINRHELLGKKLKVKEIISLLKDIEKYSEMVSRNFQPTPRP
jgi:hypothetical protein